MKKQIRFARSFVPNEMNPVHHELGLLNAIMSLLNPFTSELIAIPSLHKAI